MALNRSGATSSSAGAKSLGLGDHVGAVRPCCTGPGRVLFFRMEVEQPEWLQHIGILLPAAPNDALFQARVVNTWPPDV